VSVLGATRFADNADPRCPCVLVLDTSGSMEGEPIQALNDGLQAFQTDIQEDRLARRRTEIAIVTFGDGGVQTIQDFTEAGQFAAPTLAAAGRTPMGEAINRALDLVGSAKIEYQSNGVPYYRPWVFLITDGEPTDEWAAAAERVHTAEAANALSFFAVGVGDADMKTLVQIAPPQRPPLHLQGLAFRQLFVWFSQSQKSVSASKPGEQAPLPAIGWAIVEA